MHTRTLARLIVFFAIVCFIFASCYFFYWAGIDDDLITLWSGETLGRDWWFINYNGERSEMTSSILAALVAKIAYLLQPDASYLLNKIFLFLCAPAALYLLWRYRETYLPKPCADVMGAATMAAAASDTLLQYWSQSSMEAPLHALLLTWYAFLLIQYLQNPLAGAARKLILSQLLLILVRPEGFWAIGATGFMLWMVHGRACLSRRYAMVYMVPLAGLFVLLSLRFAATGLLFPNAAYAKMGEDGVFLWGAWRQLSIFYTFNIFQMITALMLGASVILIIRDIFKNHAIKDHIALAVLTLMILMQALFFILAGGGFGQFRLLVPSALLIYCMLFYVLACYGAMGLKHNGLLAVALAAFAIWSHKDVDRWTVKLQKNGNPHIAMAAYNLSWPDSIEQLNREAMSLQWAHSRDMEALDNFIRNGMDAQLAALGNIRIMSHQAGFFPYFIKHRYPDAPITFF